MNKTLDKTFEKAKEAYQNAYAPYSKFHVGAAFKVRNSETIVSGFNVENASYGATVCAERVALFSALSQYKTQDFEYLVIVTKTESGDLPCALCLQVLSEFVGAEFPIFSAGPHGIKKQFKFKELLPMPFNKENLP